MSDDEKRYNGWTNYETWNVALWIGNDQGSYNYWREQTAETIRGAVDRGVGLTKREQAVIDLAAVLKDEHEEMKDTILDHAKASASVWADLLGAALGEVNWHEIATHYVDDEWADAMPFEFDDPAENPMA